MTDKDVQRAAVERLKTIHGYLEALTAEVQEIATSVLPERGPKVVNAFGEVEKTSYEQFDDCMYDAINALKDVITDVRQT